MNILMCKYNNYFNKQVKKESSLSAYQTYAIKTYVNINFELNDGVNTTIVLNMDSQIFPNYIVCYNGDTIDSRWFILEQTKIRNHQYKFTLKRDVMVDFWSDIKKSPIYIEKATLKDNDPMILNSEGMRFNQIKTSEHLLKRENDFPWLLVYFTKNFDLSGMYKEGTWTKPYVQGVIDSTGNPYLMQVIEGAYVLADKYVETLSELPFTSTSTVFTENTIFSIEIPTDMRMSNGNWVKGLTYNEFKLDGTHESDFEFHPSTIVHEDSYYQLQLQDESDDLGKLNEVFSDDFLNNVIDNIPQTIKNKVWLESELLNLDGKVYYCDSNQKYYKYTVTKYSSDRRNLMSVGNGSALNIAIDTDIYDVGITSTLLHSSGYTTSFDKQLSNNELLTFGPNGYKVTLEIINRDTEDNMYFPIDKITSISSGTLESNGFYANPHTNEAYDILAIPYTDMPFNDIDTSCTANQRLALATTLISSDTVIKDIQLVPYVPIEYSIVDNKIVLVDGDYGKVPIRSGPYQHSNTIDYGIFLKQTKFTKGFDYSINIENKKVSNECDLYRLCSPNYASVFEFNPAQFDFGNSTTPIKSFNADVTLKPYQPYIHIYPSFGGLYGNNFGDARGLICEGEFSLSRLSDAFTTYALQNKNYDMQFQRSIKNMKTNYKYQLAQNVINGIGQSTAQGIGGALLAGPAGAIAGAGAGIADTVASTAFSYASYKEQKDFSKDNYNMSLQNIQAVPDTLSKVTSFTNNNKLFPFIEYYTCTEEEKESLKNKLKYDGMTVNRIGKIEDYLIHQEQFIKGELIRLDSLEEDYHLASEIYGCLLRGVYIYD